MLLLLLLPLAPFVATFGLIVVNLFNIDGAIFVVNFTVVLLVVGISVLVSVNNDGVDGVNVTVGIVVVVAVAGAVAIFDAVVVADGGSNVLVLFTDTLGITAFDVTFSL